MQMKQLGMMAAVLAAGMLTACSSPKKDSTNKGTTAATRTAETEALLRGLKQIPEKGFMFGHHDDTVYGIGWEGEEGRSDVKSVCGDYPAVISFDLGELELGGDSTLDKVPFRKIKQEIINQYRRGGMVSLSWHVRNPKTGGDAWDVSDSTVVASILPGGECHRKFSGWLADMAGFLNSLQTPEGVKIPVLFRPWHEHTGSWFWWGERLCTTDEYKQLWTMTVDSLRAHGVDNALYAYSSGTEPKSTARYLERYPGDEYIDLLGFDAYRFDNTFPAILDKALAVVDSVARSHDKVIAVTEFGYEGIPDKTWWTREVLPVMQSYPVAYALVWRNAREQVTHFYAPYPGQMSAEDFVEFYNHPKTLFAADVKPLLYPEEEKE